MVINMNTYQKAPLLNLVHNSGNIPTLDTPVEKPGNNDIKLDVMVGHMGDELQAIFQQHLYQTMVKTLHEVVKQESQKLSEKILDKLQQQLPDIIQTANQAHTDKLVSK